MASTKQYSEFHNSAKYLDVLQQFHLTERIWLPTELQLLSLASVTINLFEGSILILFCNVF